LQFTSERKATHDTHNTYYIIHTFVDNFDIYAASIVNLIYQILFTMFKINKLYKILLPTKKKLECEIFIFYI